MCSFIDEKNNVSFQGHMGVRQLQWRTAILPFAESLSLPASLVLGDIMLCLQSRSFLRPSFSLPFSPSKRLLSLIPFCVRPYSPSSNSNLRVHMSNQAIEHIVLFKVKDDVEPSQLNAMLTGLNGLISLDQVLHLTAGPVSRTGSSSFRFTHMLHSRYKSKEDLGAYAAHPRHVSVVTESVLPICEDIMAVDWVADDLQGPVAPLPGSAVRVTFLKLKENLGNEAKDEILGAIRGIRDSFKDQINQITWGENFSPARAKGFSIASIAIFPSLSELEAVDSRSEFVNLQKEKVREYLESVIVEDYVIPSPQSASL